MKPFYSSEFSVSLQQRSTSGMSDWQKTITHIIKALQRNSIMKVHRSKNSFPQLSLYVFHLLSHFIGLTLLHIVFDGGEEVALLLLKFTLMLR